MMRNTHDSENKNAEQAEGTLSLRPVAFMRSDFGTKFGLPRQSGLVEELYGCVVFEKEFSDPAAFRGLEGFSHIWLLWGFSEAVRGDWSPTVRPPRLGGNTRLGVFGTRSPFRPNPIGLSCVRLRAVRQEAGRILLDVAGADLMNGTPIYDVKPYLPLTDCRPDAASGFAGEVAGDRLTVTVPDALLERLPEDRRAPLCAVLRGDPRPSYQHTPDRIYGFSYAGFEVRFRVDDALGELTVVSIDAP